MWTHFEARSIAWPATLDAVQATDGVPISTPVNWRPGENVIAATSLSDEEVERRYGSLDKKLPYLRYVRQPERV